MSKQIWQSRDSQLISKYAERLEPVEAGEEGEEPGAESASKSQSSPFAELEGIDFQYMNGPPPKDLLNYKNMDLEMSLWAKTPTGWLSVTVLLIMAFVCFILTWILWIVHG